MLGLLASVGWDRVLHIDWSSSSVSLSLKLIRSQRDTFTSASGDILYQLFSYLVIESLLFALDFLPGDASSFSAIFLLLKLFFYFISAFCSFSAFLCIILESYLGTFETLLL